MFIFHSIEFIGGIFKIWIFLDSTNWIFAAVCKYLDCLLILADKRRYEKIEISLRSFPKRFLLSCARFTYDIYIKFFLLLLNNEEVEKLRCKLSGYMYGRHTLDTNPSTDDKRSAVYTVIPKHSLNQELNESKPNWANLIGTSETIAPLIRMLIIFARGGIRMIIAFQNLWP